MNEQPNEPKDPVELELYRYAKIAGTAGIPTASHPRDWLRFYRFIVMAHARRKGWDASDVSMLLQKYGFPKDLAREMSEIYWHARCALHLRTNPFTRDYRGWMRKKSGSCLT